MAHRLAGRCGYPPAPDEFKVTLHPDKLDEPLHWKKPSMIFVDSMGDLFHKDVPDNYLYQVFAVMGQSQRHTFQVLTKRPQRMAAWINAYTSPAFSPPARPWPLPNVWLGVSAENQATADERIPLLLQTPAAVRFMSVEPMLGAVDLTGEGHIPGRKMIADLDWVICGGESGPNARPIHPDWARSLRDQCQEAGVPFFFKQWGEWWPGERGRLYHERTMDWTDGQPMVKVGKVRAGNLLGGRKWDQMPEAQP